MITYEVTVVVEEGLVDRFERYMRATHIPEVLATGCFQTAVFARSSPGRYRTGYVARAQADLLNAASLPAMVNETLQRFGRLDVLINNASSFFPTVVGEISEREWDDLMGTKPEARFRFIQERAVFADNLDI